MIIASFLPLITRSCRMLVRTPLAVGGAVVFLSLAQSAQAQSVNSGTAAASCLSAASPAFGGQVWITGGQFILGDDSTYPEEAPAHGVALSGFWIDAHEVTNGQFARFVADTGYVTVAEREPAVETVGSGQLPAIMSEPGSIVFSPPVAGQSLRYWWSWMPGANWRQPEGPGSSINGKESFPVVHIAFEDAAAYAAWAGRALPTEAQFEMVARSKRDGRYAWAGDHLAPAGNHRANTWQGEFPLQDTAEDGYRGLAPVGCFEPNDFGVFDMIGNVWEWTSNWYFPGHRLIEPPDPQGPQVSESFSPDHPGASVKVIKGGSYLCAESYCLRFRPAARQAQEAGLGSSHIGFRTVLNQRQQQ